jgi:hypothetical protein
MKRALPGSTMLTPIISLDKVKSIGILFISILLSTLTTASPGLLNTADDRKRNGKQSVTALNMGDMANATHSATPHSRHTTLKCDTLTKTRQCATQSEA